MRCFDSRCRARSRRPGYESKRLDSETQTTRIDKGDQRQNQRVQIAMQLTENTWHTLAIRNMAKHTRNQLVLSLCLLLEGWISVVYAFTSYFKISAQPLFLSHMLIYCIARTSNESVFIQQRTVFFSLWSNGRPTVVRGKPYLCCCFDVSLRMPVQFFIDELRSNCCPWY